MKSGKKNGVNWIFVFVLVLFFIPLISATTTIDFISPTAQNGSSVEVPLIQNASTIQMNLNISNSSFLVKNTTYYLYGPNGNLVRNNYPTEFGISTGRDHTCILLNNGNVNCLGGNTYGEANNYTGGDAIQVSAGLLSTCILLNNGNVQCQGWNENGQSDNYTRGDAVGISSGGYQRCIILSNGNVDCGGLFYGGGNAIQVSSGFYYTCILLNNGSVYCDGHGVGGRPTGYLFNDSIQVSNAYFHICALKSNGNVQCLGDNYNDEANNYTGRDAIQISTGGSHTCALLSNGNVQCWGGNGAGQSNNYTGGDAIQVSAGYDNTCILRSNGNTYCWGSNTNGKSYDYMGNNTKRMPYCWFKIFDAGIYHYNATVCDIFGTCVSTGIRDEGFISPLDINIISPYFGNYSLSNFAALFDLNFNVSFGADKCWYSVNNGPNISTDCRSKISSQGVYLNLYNWDNVSQNQGYHTWTIWANNSLGELVSDSVRFYVDFYNPNINFLDPTPTDQSYFRGNSFIVSVNASEYTSDVNAYSGLKNVTISLYYLNGSLMESASHLSGGIFSHRFSNISPGSYNYYAAACDNVGNCPSVGRSIIFTDKYCDKISLSNNLELRAHFDASNISQENGTDVTIWNDLSGYGNNATLNGTSFPQLITQAYNNRSTVRFNPDAQGYYYFTNPIEDAKSIFVIGKAGSEGDNGGPGSEKFYLGNSMQPTDLTRGFGGEILGTGAWGEIYLDSSSRFSSVNATTGKTYFNWQLVDGTQTTLGLDLFTLGLLINGTVNVSEIGTSQTSSLYNYGSLENYTISSWDGDMNEILIYNKTLNDSELYNLNVYLYCKWQGNISDINIASEYCGDGICNNGENESSCPSDCITTSLSVSIIYPQSTNYTSNITALNYTVSGINLSSCWYSLDVGVTNVSTNCSQDISGITSVDGSNIWTIWANDSFGNVTFDSVVFLINSSCIPNLQNTSWSNWTNLTCYADQMNQSRFKIQYDSNGCVANQTIYDYQLAGQNLQNTSWSGWTNISCLASNLMNQSRNLTQYDSYFCAANQTFTEYQNTLACVYSMPDNPSGNSGGGGGGGGGGGAILPRLNKTASNVSNVSIISNKTNANASGYQVSNEVPSSTTSSEIGKISRASNLRLTVGLSAGILVLLVILYLYLTTKFFRRHFRKPSDLSRWIDSENNKNSSVKKTLGIDPVSSN